MDKTVFSKNRFETEPIRRLTFCMVKNSLFRSTPLNHSPFSYQKFGVQRVEIQRGNGVPLAGTRWTRATMSVFILIL